ncbi:hypothetical protein [Deinococcus maricopensis]|uniref:hypothetical protein n=1 Tax=Deinococcus maricopensis TaxID=309887 RepID=UPI0011D1C267|nr:hypothetical protein [Deinococcus maricopensis]
MHLLRAPHPLLWAPLIPVALMIAPHLDPLTAVFPLALPLAGLAARLGPPRRCSRCPPARGDSDGPCLPP